VAEKISRLQNELNGMTQTGEAETALNGCSGFARFQAATMSDKYTPKANIHVC
jgi:hypothetical protein